MKILRSLLFAPLALLAATSMVGACGSNSDSAVQVPLEDSGDKPQVDSSRPGLPDGPPVKPAPQPSDAGTSDAKPPTPPIVRPDGGGDAGKLTDASIDATVDPDAGTIANATPLDPVDEFLMPDYGLDVGTCSSVGLAAGTGVCRIDFITGEDYIEGCVSPDAYLLDCKRYDTAGSVRSICLDDGKAAGCNLIDVTPVDAFEKSQTSSALDIAPCPSSWEGYGNCTGDFVNMCVGGEDYALDCTIYNQAGFTYTCGKNSSGKITCL